MRINYFFLAILLTSCVATGAATKEVLKEYGLPTEVYFCPENDCKSILMQYFSSSNKIDCAMYSLNIPEIMDILKNKSARMVMDNDEAQKELNPVVDGKYALMHNKFCILDNQTVITGSLNPTLGEGIEKNNNNVIIFHSKNIAKVYEEEFNELYSGTFSGGEPTSNNIFYLNNDEIEVYFCPEDWCANKVLYALDNAQNSVYFLVYSFTHDKIGDLLVNKHNQGLTIEGVMEKSQNSKFSEYQKLIDAGIPVKWDANKALMHNKIFIIDENTVITGSFNPTTNGDVNNDENLVIVHSQDIAKKYLEEFNLLYNQ